MLNLQTITITASVSKNYQKGEVTATATVENAEDIAALKELCRTNAIELLDSLPIPPEIEKEKKSNQNNNYVPVPKANTGANKYQPEPEKEVRMATENQIAYLKNKFGYSGPENITFAAADKLLKQYKGEI